MQHTMAKTDLMTRAQARSSEVGTQVRHQATRAAHGMRHLMSNAVRRAQGKSAHPARARVQEVAARAVQAGRTHPRAVLGAALLAMAAVARRRRNRRR